MDRYLSRLSRPLIDRIDIHVEVPAVHYKQLTSRERGTDSATMRKQVVACRKVQAERNGGPLRPNSTLSGRELDKVAPLDDPCKELMRQAMTELGLSARAYDKVRRVARTIADLEGSERIRVQDMSEAVGYRLLDRQQ